MRFLILNHFQEFESLVATIFAHQMFRFRIKCWSSFVQQQNYWSSNKCSCDSNSLLLPTCKSFFEIQLEYLTATLMICQIVLTGHLASLLTNICFIAIRRISDKVVSICKFRCILNFIHSNIFNTITNVLSHWTWV